MLTASILAKKGDVPVHTVRHYTKLELLKPKIHPQNGYRIYKHSDEIRLRFIRTAKDLGFSLTEISEILDEAEQGISPCPMVREIIEKRIAENKEKIRQMQVLQIKMEKARKDWGTMEDALPNGHSVCHLIESIAE